MKLYYSNQLRQFDVGVLILGSNQISIPGDNPYVTSLPENICPSTCTSKLSNNITVISNALHMHTLGLNITTRHVRQNTELPPLGKIQYYDFGHQKQALVTDPITRIVAPGDSLRTKCTYLHTLGERSNINKFGEATTDEMCYNFLFYFPKSDAISQCIQQPYQMNSTSWATCTTQSTLSKMRQYVQNLKLNNASWMNLDQITFSLKVASLLREQGLIVRVDESENNFDAYNPTCLKSQKKSLDENQTWTSTFLSMTTVTLRKSGSTELYLFSTTWLLMGYMMAAFVLQI